MPEAEVVDVTTARIDCNSMKTDPPNYAESSVQYTEESDFKPLADL